MSSQKGNIKKTRPQKHQNVRAFKNDLHDKSKKMQNIKSMSLCGICQRCKEKIEWKIKYRKYKPLTVLRKCVGCGEKRIKQAYYTLCSQCAANRGVCAKCAERGEIVSTTTLSAEEQAANDSQLKRELEMLPERKRRTFFRLQAQGKLCNLPRGRDEESCGTPHSSSSEDDSDEETPSSGSAAVNTNSADSESTSLTHVDNCNHTHNQQNGNIDSHEKYINKGDNSA